MLTDTKLTGVTGLKTGLIPKVRPHAGFSYPKSPLTQKEGAPSPGQTGSQWQGPHSKSQVLLLHSSLPLPIHQEPI